MTSIAVAVPLLAQEPAPTAAATPAAEPAASVPESDGGPTVSTPPMAAAPAAGGVRLKQRVVPGKPVSLSRGAASTVTAYEKKRFLTVRTPAGRLVRYRLAKDAAVPPDLSSGRAVLVETKVVKKRRYASRVTYAESRLVMTNMD